VVKIQKLFAEHRAWPISIKTQPKGSRPINNRIMDKFSPIDLYSSGTMYDITMQYTTDTSTSIERQKRKFGG